MLFYCLYSDALSLSVYLKHSEIPLRLKSAIARSRLVVKQRLIVKINKLKQECGRLVVANVEFFQPCVTFLGISLFYDLEKLYAKVLAH